MHAHVLTRFARLAAPLPLPPPPGSPCCSRTGPAPAQDSGPTAASKWGATMRRARRWCVAGAPPGGTPALHGGPLCAPMPQVRLSLSALILHEAERACTSRGARHTARCSGAAPPMCMRVGLLAHAGTTTFASGEICGDAPSLGYFYIHNSCNLTLTFSVKVRTPHAHWQAAGVSAARPPLPCRPAAHHLSVWMKGVPRTVAEAAGSLTGFHRPPPLPHTRCR